MKTILFVLSVAIAQAQASFEVATIRPVDAITSATRQAGVKISPGGRLQMRGMPLKSLISAAFDLSYWQLSPGEPWMDKDTFDIEAKPAESDVSKIKTLRFSYWDFDDPHLREMLQTLLIERFHLKFHRESKTGAVYVIETSGKPARFSVDASQPPVESADNRAYGTVEFSGGSWAL